MKKISRPLRVGFDLDGVILYNPARIIRPIVTGVKRLIMKKRKTSFYIPNTPFEKFIWYLLHKSSLFVSPGYSEIKKLVKNNSIEAYLITSRYSFLKKDFESWKKKLSAETVFVQCFMNEHNEQPHKFKEKMVQSLKLDVFIEDNWDIVEHLSKKCPDTRILWIYNIFDRGVTYPYRFNLLNKAVKALSSIVP